MINMSQEQFAKEIGVSSVIVEQWESGKKRGLCIMLLERGLKARFNQLVEVSVILVEDFIWGQILFNH